MNFLDRLEAQLLSAPPPRRRPSKRTFVAVSVVGLALSGTALAATQPWTPVIGDKERGTPLASTVGVPQEQLDGMVVLRRPQTTADRGTVVRQALRLTDDNVDGVRVNAARVLVSPALTAALIPVERFNLRTSRMIRPEMPDQVKQLIGIHHDGLCVFAPERNGDGGGYHCSTWQQVQAGELPSSLGPVLYGIVPDGVAQVEVDFTNAPQSLARVDDNFYALRALNTDGDRVPRIKIVRWLNGSGAYIKEIRTPQPPANETRRRLRQDRR